MLESINIIKNTFIEYKGTGSYITLFILAIIYLFFKEENREKRMFFVYFQILIFLVVFNPIFNKIVGPIFKSSIYWRVYWIIPLGITIAYAAVKLISEFSQEKVKRVVLYLSFIFVIMVSGKFIYTNVNYQKVGNLYKIQDEKVLVTQLIGADDEEYKKAIVPETIVPYVRQIDASIELAYKREAYTYENHPITSKLHSGNTEEIVKVAKEKGCNYIVVDKNIIKTAAFSYYGFELFNETPNFEIYKSVEKINKK